MFLGVFSQAQADLGDYGMTGLIDMPSARMQPDGAFGATYVRQDVADTFALTYQATPWLETAFRYHILSPRNNIGDLYDRSYEIKIRLFEETNQLPQVAIGVRDLFGTGIYSGEYLVGSKSISNLDATLGLGWGRLAGRARATNPFTYVSSTFNERNSEIGLGGELRVDDYFSGPEVGIFGGVAYTLSGSNLKLFAEYNSDTYVRERRESAIDLNSPWSFGVNWEPVEDVILGVSWQHGSEIGLRLTSVLDSSRIMPREARPLVATIEGDSTANYANQQAPDWYSRLAYDATQTGLWLVGASIVASDQVVLEYENDHYQLQTDAAERLVQLAELHLPPEFRVITLVYSENGMHAFSIQYRRQDWSNVYSLASGQSQIRDALTILPSPSDWKSEFYTRSPFNIRTFADIKPRFSFFDPDNPARYQFYLGLNAYSSLGKGWRVQGGLMINLLTNFDGITRESDSVLPHVRSDFAKYLNEGKTGMGYLFFDKHGQLEGSVFYRGFGGYLEEMYAGIGGELLYRPFRSRWAIGVNMIGVRQRNYDKRLDFLDYQTTIGHLSVYWASPVYNYDFALHIGRYLAGDWGQTIEVKRRFANGWEVGAFATFTDVSAEEFGEGSFDKGITLRIPLSAISSGDSRRSGINTVVRPLTRDGGQWLDIGTSLWDTLRSSNYDELTIPERLDQ